MDFRSLALDLKRELDEELGELPALGQPRGRRNAARYMLKTELDHIVAGRRRFQWTQAARLFGLMPRQEASLALSPPDLLAHLRQGLEAGQSVLVVGSSREEIVRALDKSPVKPMGTAGQWAEALRPLVQNWEIQRNQRQEAYARQERLARAQARLKEMIELRAWQLRVAEKAVTLAPEVERLRSVAQELEQRLAEADRQAERARKAGSLGRWAMGLKADARSEERDQISLELRMALGALHIRETELQKLQDEALSRQSTLRDYSSRFAEEFGVAPDPVEVARQLQETKEQARHLDALVREAAVAMEQGQKSLLQGARLVGLAFDEWPNSPVLLDLEYDVVVALDPAALHPAFLFLVAGLARSQVVVMGEPPRPPAPRRPQRRRLKRPVAGRKRGTRLEDTSQGNI
ncbi:MAG: hypothetical protein ACYC5Y_09250 [Symbiobacteriia bacterium]